MAFIEHLLCVFWPCAGQCWRARKALGGEGSDQSRKLLLGGGEWGLSVFCPRYTSSLDKTLQIFLEI